MFVINVNQIDKKKLYKCDLHMSNMLQRNGFPLFSIEKDDYFFVKTKELCNFLNLEGGEKDE